MALGMRHPFLGKYKVGFTAEGKLVSLESQVYSNGGYSMDLSLAVLERSLTHSDNCYYIPNVHLHGRICKTNLPTNTAFRGFGGPQGLMIAEQWITHVAEYLKKPLEEIRVGRFAELENLKHSQHVIGAKFLPRGTVYSFQYAFRASSFQPGLERASNVF